MSARKHLLRILKTSAGAFERLRNLFDARFSRSYWVNWSSLLAFLHAQRRMESKTSWNLFIKTLRTFWFVSFNFRVRTSAQQLEETALMWKVFLLNFDRCLEKFGSCENWEMSLIDYHSKLSSDSKLILLLWLAQLYQNWNCFLCKTCADERHTPKRRLEYS